MDEGLGKNFLYTRSGFFNLSAIDTLDQIMLSVEGAIQCIIRCLAASLDSYLLDTSSTPSDVIITNLSRYFP